MFLATALSPLSKARSGEIDQRVNDSLDEEAPFMKDEAYATSPPEPRPKRAGSDHNVLIP